MIFKLDDTKRIENRAGKVESFYIEENFVVIRQGGLNCLVGAFIIHFVKNIAVIIDWNRRSGLGIAVIVDKFFRNRIVVGVGIIGVVVGHKFYVTFSDNEAFKVALIAVNDDRIIWRVEYSAKVGIKIQDNGIVIVIFRLFVDKNERAVAEFIYIGAINIDNQLLRRILFAIYKNVQGVGGIFRERGS